mmetsp:Transcript_35511/g.92551  ORF Transcript_35511/g.92551 Transcript_35511/m.92551 type:complete len:313 (-) Transcript_35511:393-1331(-)|eukprot:CAMPEP_0113879712 /NCGR_PEP_ID=MMETSP0780_2-20120614/7386_1 /TAXON_ID=652834 /ORGANISM="Palpitomonas bilix" /LENGTH=312 /DNA_ID=CAMNT_0000866315 /DNA_START=417 /DNA_END=1355 /DNA_ORIENTATION=+ /assembly_acc=CAM_ASM_000599
MGGGSSKNKGETVTEVEEFKSSPSPKKASGEDDSGKETSNGGGGGGSKREGGKEEEVEKNANEKGGKVEEEEKKKDEVVAVVDEGDMRLEEEGEEGVDPSVKKMREEEDAMKKFLDEVGDVVDLDGEEEEKKEEKAEAEEEKTVRKEASFSVNDASKEEAKTAAVVEPPKALSLDEEIAMLEEGLDMEELDMEGQKPPAVGGGGSGEEGGSSVKVEEAGGHGSGSEVKEVGKDEVEEIGDLHNEGHSRVGDGLETRGDVVEVFTSDNEEVKLAGQEKKKEEDEKEGAVEKKLLEVDEEALMDEILNDIDVEL